MNPAVIVSESERCTEATLKAFGIEGIVPKTNSGVLRVLIENGFSVEQLQYSPPPRLRWVLEQLKSGNYYIQSPGHAMALINGKLVDTANLPTSTRIERIWRVTKNV